MPINPPYRFDPIQNAVNVKWGGRTLTASWQMFSDSTNSGIIDCNPAGTVSAITFLINPPTLLESIYPVSGSPTGGGEIAVGPGTYSSMFFAPDVLDGEESAAERRGSAPGSGSFEVLGSTCALGSETAGSIPFSIPMMTQTDPDTGTVYELSEWSATAAFGIVIHALFRVREEEE
jgi:hypothetical protein